MAVLSPQASPVPVRRQLAARKADVEGVLRTVKVKHGGRMDPR